MHRILVSLQVKETVQGIGQQLHRGDQDVECLGEQGDGPGEVRFP